MSRTRATLRVTAAAALIAGISATGMVSAFAVDSAATPAYSVSTVTVDQSDSGVSASGPQTVELASSAAVWWT
ncbi:hypothetical protein [Actinacidiphila yeochonensis]|uniref:hypothetical protein n=1 Tax=Actinacidiphila yeochonensis TaxID=89050 RepID=UPI000568A98F|nr:hypothetical protein [Actinacidiphila yeochonensis]